MESSSRASRSRSKRRPSSASAKATSLSYGLRSPLPGRAIRRVRIEQMDPREPRLIRGRGRGRYPVAGELRHAVRGPFRKGKRHRSRVAAHRVVVRVESAREAEPRVEHERADERAGAVPGVVQKRGERRRAGGERGGAVVADAVRRRCEAGKNGRVGRQRHRRVRVRVGEADAARGQPIDRRRSGPPE